MSTSQFRLNLTMFAVASLLLLAATVSAGSIRRPSVPNAQPEVAKNVQDSFGDSLHAATAVKSFDTICTMNWTKCIRKKCKACDNCKIYCRFSNTIAKADCEYINDTYCDA